jgi:hypothetical protein
MGKVGWRLNFNPKTQTNLLAGNILYANNDSTIKENEKARNYVYFINEFAE